MNLPKEAIEEYQKLYKQYYNKEISYQDAEKQAQEFLLIMKNIYKPIKKSWLLEYLGKGNK